MRMPRIHALPPMIFGSKVIRLNISKPPDQYNIGRRRLASASREKLGGAGGVGGAGFRADAQPAHRKRYGVESDPRRHRITVPLFDEFMRRVMPSDDWRI